jgi:hypothetical protein
MGVKRDKSTAHRSARGRETGRRTAPPHLEEEVEAGGGLSRSERAPERLLNVPHGGAGGEPDGRGPPVQGPDLDLPLILRHRDFVRSARQDQHAGQGRLPFGSRRSPGRWRVLARGRRGRRRLVSSVCACRAPNWAGLANLIWALCFKIWA